MQVLDEGRTYVIAETMSGEGKDQHLTTHIEVADEGTTCVPAETKSGEGRDQHLTHMEVLDEGTPAETKSGMGRNEQLEERNIKICFTFILKPEDNLCLTSAIALPYAIFGGLRISAEEMERRGITEEDLKSMKGMTVDQYMQLKRIIQQIILLAILLNGPELKAYIRLERDGSCCAIVLLSNKGAHAYYGNGNFLAKHRRCDRLPLITHEEIEFVVEENRIVIQSRPIKSWNTSVQVGKKATCVDASTQCEIDEFADTSNLSVDILRRKPSDQELWTIGFNIGWEYPQLASMLGLSETELYHIKYDNRDNCVQRNKAMLFKWRENRENDGTFEELRNACIRAKINPGKILEGIE